MTPDPSMPKSTDNDTPDARPVHESESDKLYNDPKRRPRLPNTEGENVDPGDDLNPPPRPTHNPFEFIPDLLAFKLKTRLSFS